MADKKYIRVKGFMSTEEFIDRATKIHNGKYSYEKVEYTGINNQVIITCPIHGDFKQTPNNHLQGSGCKMCMKEKFSLGQEEFIKRARKIHGDKYDYSKVKYVNGQTKVTIICPIHGEFQQTAERHILGQGCKLCKESKLERSTDLFLTNNNIQFEREKRFSWLGQKRLDFYIPQFNAAIECQGLQHFQATGYIYGEEKLKRTIESDEIKRKLCEEHGIKIYYYTNLENETPYFIYRNLEDLIHDMEKEQITPIPIIE